MTIGSADQKAKSRNRLRFGGADDLRQVFGPELFPAFVEGDDPSIGLLEEGGRLGSLASVDIAILAVFDLKDFNGRDALQSVQIEGTAFGIETALDLADCDDPVSHGFRLPAASRPARAG